MSRKIGTIIWFNHYKGFGFIKYNNERIYFYQNQINKKLYRHDIVSFELYKTSRGYRAKNIRKEKQND